LPDAAVLARQGFIDFRFIRLKLLAIVGRETNRSTPHAVSVAACEPGTAKVLHRFARTLELEVTAGVLVLAVAGILGVSLFMAFFYRGAV
jgi:hypothetical protein